MRKIFIFILTSQLIFSVVNAQNSAFDLLRLKERAEDYRVRWVEAFTEGVETKNLNGLRSIRQEAEHFLNQYIHQIELERARGDVRPMLVAIGNYLKIQKQFVTSVMVSAESVSPDDQAAIDDIQHRIENFGKKERVFLMEIENARRTSAYLHEPEGSQIPEMESDIFQGERRLPASDEKPKRRRKLPHER